MNSLYLALLWFLYYALHSAFAANPVKRFFKRVFPHVYLHYRALYSIIAVVNFVLLAGLHYRLPSATLFTSTGGLKVAAIVFALAGLCVFIVSARGYGIEFLFRDEQEGQSSTLHTGGLNAYVRHPLYFSFVLMLISLVLYYPLAKHWAFAGVSALYIYIGARFEEGRLISSYGEEYLDYKRKVKMLIPYLF